MLNVGGRIKIDARDPREPLNIFEREHDGTVF